MIGTWLVNPMLETRNRIRCRSAAFTPLHRPLISAYSGYSAVKNLIREIRAIRGRLRICGEMQTDKSARAKISVT